METIEYKGYEIIIEQDERCESPRTMYENLGTMIYNHKNYVLGDVAIENSSFDTAKLKRDIKSGKLISLPLYLFDHSGITMNTTGFNCQWDSGMIGWIFIEKEKVREEFGWKHITKSRKQQIETSLKNEVKTFDDFLTGAVYGYTIKKNGESIANDIDSCWGFFGSDYKKSGLMDDAKSLIDHNKERTERNEGVQTKLCL